jgi:hypothetical protein
VVKNSSFILFCKIAGSSRMRGYRLFLFTHKRRFFMKQVKNLFGVAIALAIVVSMAALLAGCSDGGEGGDGGGGGGGNPVVINIAAISGVTAPVSGAEPVTAITETAQYTGTVSWKNARDESDIETFAAKTVYTATIILTAKTGFTLTGVTANFFTVAGGGDGNQSG